MQTRSKYFTKASIYNFLIITEHVSNSRGNIIREFKQIIMKFNCVKAASLSEHSNVGNGIAQPQNFNVILRILPPQLTDVDLSKMCFLVSDVPYTHTHSYTYERKAITIKSKVRASNFYHKLFKNICISFSSERKEKTQLFSFTKETYFLERGSIVYQNLKYTGNRNIHLIYAGNRRIHR